MRKQLLPIVAVALLDPSFVEAHGIGGVHADPEEVRLEIETIGKDCLEQVFATLNSVERDEMGRVRRDVKTLDEASMDRISAVHNPLMNEDVVTKAFQSAGSVGNKIGFINLNLYGGNAYIRTHTIRVSSRIYNYDGQDNRNNMYNFVFDCIYDPDLVEIIDIKLVN